MNLTDFEKIYPEKGKLLKSLVDYINIQKEIMNDESLMDNEKSKQIDELNVDFGGSKCTLEGTLLE